ncbi:MAG: hypothetical protein HC837_00795 [Chloroflexaceae bacterium]|nr:hypothetical protein [Chloroflexaceae bacterium]
MRDRAKRGLALPEIIYQPSPYTHDIGQCDACAPVAVVSPHRHPETVTSACRYIRSAVMIQSIEPTGYYTLISPQLTTLVVVNTSALMYINFFIQPQTVDTVPADWQAAWGHETITTLHEQLVTLGLLQPVVS